MSRAQILSGAAQTSGLDEAVLEDLLDRLYVQFPQQVPDDWAVLREWLVDQLVSDEQADGLLTHLAEIENAAAEHDPRVLLDDPVLRGVDEPESGSERGLASEPESTSGPEWLAPGSQIYRASSEFYLADGRQVWQTDDGGQTYFHDGTNAYDAMGGALPPAEPAPAATPEPQETHRDPVAPGGRIHRVGTEFYLDGEHQVWEATDGGRTYFHDGTNTYDAMGGASQAPAEPAQAEPVAGTAPEPTHEEVVAQTVETVRPILDAAIAAVPGAERLTPDEIQEVLARVAGNAPAAR